MKIIPIVLNVILPIYLLTLPTWTPFIIWFVVMAVVGLALGNPKKNQ
jgi:hypothetical protein